MTGEPNDSVPNADERVAALLSETLDAQAGAAPLPRDLAGAARSQARRRTVRTGAVVGLVTAGAAAAVVVPVLLSGADAGGGGLGVETGAAGTTVSASAGATVGVAGGGPTPAPDGWMWQSYGTVSLLVPADWARGTTGAPPCIARTDAPTVGRPGPVEAVLCMEDFPELANRHVWFDEFAATPGRVEAGLWVRETRVIGGVPITIELDDAALVEEIFASAVVSEIADPNGCSPTSPLAVARDVRPAAWDVAAAGPVELGSACVYAVPEDAAEHGSLVASRALDVDEARAVVAAVAAAPVGGGPNDPTSCVPEVSYGEQMLVVTLKTADGWRQLLLRYTGCDHRGIDDGTNLRTLTRPAVQAIFNEWLTPWSYSGGPDGYQDLFQ